MNEKISKYSFNINIKDDALKDINLRLRNSRIINDFGNNEWDYGTSASYLKDLISYWANDYKSVSYTHLTLPTKA